MKKNTLLVGILIIMLAPACSSGVQAPSAINQATPRAIAKSLASVNTQESLHLFDYDVSQPIDIQNEQKTQGPGWTQIDFSYASPKGGRVPARLVIPEGEGPFPGLLLQHGSLGNYENFTVLARALAHYGTVVLMINDPYSRQGGWQPTEFMGTTWPYYTAQDLEYKIQYIIDLRRAIDILAARPEVNPERLAYWGFSYGGAMGGLLAGIENRLGAYVLQVGDGGLVEHTSEPDEFGLPAHFAADWAALMWPTESLHFIDRAAPAAILFQNGIHDINVPPSDALRYQTAASEPKTVIWYNSDHSLPPQAFLDATTWLQPYLGEDLLWFTPNYRPGALLVDRLFTLWLISVFASLLLFHVDANRLDILPIKERLGWSLNILILGPLGVVIYWFSLRQIKERMSGNGSITIWKRTLVMTSFTTTNLVAGLVIGSVITNLIPSIDFRVTLILIYAIMLICCWALNILSRGLYHLSTFGLILFANIALAVTLLLSILTNTPDVPARLSPGMWWVATLTAITIMLATWPVHLLLLRKGWVNWGDQVDHNTTQSGRSRSIWIVQASLFSLSILGILASIMIFVWSQVDLDIMQILALLTGQDP